MSNIGRLIYINSGDSFFYEYDHGEKRIEAEGYDWIVARDSNNKLSLVQFASSDIKQVNVEKWANNHNIELDGDD